MEFEWLIFSLCVCPPHQEMINTSVRAESDWNPPPNMSLIAKFPGVSQAEGGD